MGKVNLTFDMGQLTTDIGGEPRTFLLIIPSLRRIVENGNARHQTQ